MMALPGAIISDGTTFGARDFIKWQFKLNEIRRRPNLAGLMSLSKEGENPGMPLHSENKTTRGHKEKTAIRNAEDRGLRGPNLNDTFILFFWPLDLQEKDTP